MMQKPLGQKAYGHIPHLPGSRMGPGDHHVHPGQERICLGPIGKGARPDKRDRIIVQEKLDGSCCAIACLDDGLIVALGRAGHLAQTSKYEQHQWFADWVRRREPMFRELLTPGERIVGEWLAQAHGTRYDLAGRMPFVAFDIMRGTTRTLWGHVEERLSGMLTLPRVISVGPPVAVDVVMALVDSDRKYHGAIEDIEGAVWRVERDEAVDFLAKWVRPDKMDGRYLPEVSGLPAVWNWRPEKETTG